MKTDISHLKEQARQVDIVSLAEKRTVLRKESGNSLCGPCPKCGGDDRFYIRTDRNKFYCRGCRNSGGDPITFICWLKGREPKGRDFIEAVEYLTNSKIEIGNGRINNYRRIQVEKKNEKEIRRPDKKWGGRAALISNRAREVLWTDAGKPGRDYLYGRGLTDDTIRHFELGYIPRDVFDKAENWGLSGDKDKDVYLPKGIAIPWWYFGDLARLNIRRIGDLGDGPKYIGPRGWAGTQPVFNVDSVDKGSVVIVVEGEMDAMLLWKAIGEKVVPVAIGSAKGCRSDLWVETFKICETVIVALDSDEAGDNASNWWIDRLPNAVRLSPDGGKDVGEMVENGIDLEVWLRRVVSDFSLDSTKNEPQLQSDEQQPQPTPPQQKPVDRYTDWTDEQIRNMSLEEYWNMTWYEYEQAKQREQETERTVIDFSEWNDCETQPAQQKPEQPIQPAQPNEQTQRLGKITLSYRDYLLNRLNGAHAGMPFYRDELSNLDNGDQPESYLVIEYEGYISRSNKYTYPPDQRLIPKPPPNDFSEWNDWKPRSQKAEPAEKKHDNPGQQLSITE